MSFVEQDRCPLCDQGMEGRQTAAFGEAACPRCRWRWWFAATPAGVWYFSCWAERDAVFRFLPELSRRPDLDRHALEDLVRDLEDRFPGPTWEGEFHCRTCTHFRPDEPRPRDGMRPGRCTRYGKPVHDGHICVCRDWCRPRVGPAAVLQGLEPGKLYEINGAYERFDEVADLTGRAERGAEWRG